MIDLPRRRFLLTTAALAAPALLRGQARDAEFDFIIIGAGSSGCVVADRLSANPANRVLLIEAGGPAADPAIQAPGQWTSLLGGPLDWGYETEPEAGLADRALKWPRGKVYGGSSAINAMAFTRGHRRCYDTWAREAGSTWSYNALFPIFRRIETNSRGSSYYHGGDGPLCVSDTLDPHAGHYAFLEAAHDRGFDADPYFDFDGARQENGAGFYQKNIKDGRRHSAADAYLAPALSRSNLVVWPNTAALHLTFDGRRASGVDVMRAGAPAHARAARRIILCAGAIDSPRLLMLSGIGPANDLRKLGLPVVADSPNVGGNLQDHLRVSVRWAAEQPLAPSTVSAGLFTFSTAAANRRQAAPDIQFYVGRGLDAPDQFITLTVAMSQPASRGRVSLRSADPSAPAVIRPGYLSASSDLAAMIEGVRLAQLLASARSYTALRGRPTDVAGDRFTGPDELGNYIRRSADTIFHPVGTCRMGTGNDAVVDWQLRVRGVDGLSVADASVIPVNLNSQIHAACVVIGERAAELVG